MNLVPERRRTGWSLTERRGCCSQGRCGQLQFLLGIDVLGNESSCDEPQADVEQTGASV